VGGNGWSGRLELEGGVESGDESGFGSWNVRQSGNPARENWGNGNSKIG